jgi:hypothetical protein
MDNHEMKYSEKKLRKIKMSGFFFAKHATKNLCDDHQKNSHQIGKRVLLVDPNQSLRQQKQTCRISFSQLCHSFIWHDISGKGGVRQSVGEQAWVRIN